MTNRHFEKPGQIEFNKRSHIITTDNLLKIF